MENERIVGHGSLLIAWRLNDRKVAIVGGGEVAAQRVKSLLATDVDKIWVIAPSSGLHPLTSKLIGQYPERIEHVDQEFSFSNSDQKDDVTATGKMQANVDLLSFDMVLTAIDNYELSKRIVEDCRKLRVPVNAADIPELCDFYFGGMVRDGPLQIMVSTNGNAPRLAALIKDKIKNALVGCEGDALTQVGILRQKLKERAPGVGGEVGRRRMRWMSRICERWSMKELASLDEETMDWLLDEGWEKDHTLDPPRKPQRFGALLGTAATVTLAIGTYLLQSYLL